VGGAGVGGASREWESTSELRCHFFEVERVAVDTVLASMRVGDGGRPTAAATAATADAVAVADDDDRR